MELNVANMSSPLIRENRHSDVDMMVLNLKWPEYHPARKCEAHVEKEGTDEESEHVGGSPLHGQNEDVVGFEESEISEDSEPD